MKRAFSGVYHISKTFNAPLQFVFAWCTDFREDDPKMNGENRLRHIIERTKERVIWSVSYKEKGEDHQGVRVVWLSPPNSWHMDTCGDMRRRGDYILKPLGKNKTRLDIAFVETWDKKTDVEPPEKWERDIGGMWDAFGRFLEKDFRESNTAPSHV
jgi:hypothetical protein